VSYAVVANQPGGLPALNFKPVTADGLATALAPMLVVAILIERAVEVIFGIWREPDDRRLEGLASDARHVTRSLLTPARDDEAFRTLAAARVGTLASAARDAPEVLLSKLSINAETIAGANLAAIADTANRIETGARAAIREREAAATVLAFVLAMGLGLFAAIIGMRVLPNLLAAPGNGLTAGPRLALDFLDVWLSASLLAGGAEGFHHITSTIRAFLEASKAKAEDANPKMT
jgi:hypothetical protein